MQPGRRAGLVSPALPHGFVCTTQPHGVWGTSAEQHGGHTGRGCLLKWVLWLPAPFCPTNTQTSGLWSQSECVQILALPLVHHDLVRFLCARFPCLQKREGFPAPAPTGALAHLVPVCMQEARSAFLLGMRGHFLLSDTTVPTSPPAPNTHQLQKGRKLGIHHTEDLGAPGSS